MSPAHREIQARALRAGFSFALLAGGSAALILHLINHIF